MGILALIALVVGGVWLWTRSRGEAAPPVLTRTIGSSQKLAQNLLGSGLAGQGAPDFGPPPREELEPEGTNVHRIDG